MKIFLRTGALLLATALTAVVLSSACGNGVKLTSIAVTPAAPSLAAGATQQFTATGTRSDNSTVDLTATATWASSDTAVAAFETPDTNGLATAVAAGSSTISATDPDSGISSTDSGGDSTVTVTALSSTIKALYPTNGADWNDYVKNDRADMFKATDTACNPATDGPGYNACLNGGPLRTVDVTGRTVCDDLTATDSLGVFNWVCDDTTNDVRMVSVGFARGKGLSDLIDFDTASWKQMNVTVYRSGNAYLATDMAAWWGNPIILDNDGNDGTAMSAGEIYIITANPGAIYTIGADQIAILVKPGLSINGPGTSADIIDVSNHNFAWAEGWISAVNDDTGYYLNTAKFSQLRNVKIGQTATAGVYMINSSSNLTTDVVVGGGADDGITLNNSDNNLFVNITSSNNHSEGVDLNATSVDNTFFNTTSLSNGSNSFYLLGATNNLFFNSTDVNGNTSLALYNSANNNTFLNFAMANSSSRGLSWNNTSDNNTVVNLASAHHLVTAVYINNCSNNYFSGLFMVGNSGADCSATGTLPGIDNNCNPNGASDFGSPITGISLASSFVAKASSDSENANGATGTETFGNITDWINFENQYRGWGKDGSSFPNVDHTEDCTAGTCRIWDWSLTSTDTVARDVLSLPTGNDTLTHTWSDASTITFLRNSVEIMEDGIGNENGLCESNETCLYTPNIGSYQGHGNLISAGTFTDGTITGVTLMQYETNGM